jgi:YD repeat-containing protein
MRRGTIASTYNLAGEITSITRLSGHQVTHTYDLNGNVIVSNGLQLNIGNALVTMVYDKENRGVVNNRWAIVVSYTYSGDGLKRSEISSTGNVTTLVWDGSEYLQERS